METAGSSWTDSAQLGKKLVASNLPFNVFITFILLFIVPLTPHYFPNGIPLGLAKLGAIVAEANVSPFSQRGKQIMRFGCKKMFLFSVKNIRLPGHKTLLS